MGKKSFLIDVDKCSGCSLCIIACKDEHVGNSYAPWTATQPDTGHFWIDVIPVERGKTPRVKMSYLPLLCQHCENAPCIKVCPEGAIKRRDDGLVWIDPETCNGCGLCQKACPYDVIYLNDDLGIAQKCTGCAHRVDEGLLPRCAEVCPHDAIVFADETDSVFSQEGQAKRLEIYHSEYQAEPRVYWRGFPKPWIAGIVIDAGTDDVILGAAITSIDLFDDRAVMVQSDEFGDFWIRELDKDRKYSVEIKKEGYEGFRAVVTTDGDQDLGEVRLKKTG
jgi:Fe-S-cluster-containing dehydrogenase component